MLHGAMMNDMRSDFVTGSRDVHMHYPHSVIAAMNESEKGEEGNHRSDIDKDADQDCH